MPAGSPGGKHLRAVVAVVTLVLVLASCTVVRGTITTIKALSQAGYSSPQIRSETGDRVVVTVTRRSDDLETAARDAARIVWDELPLRIEHLVVVCENGFGGSGRFEADRAALEEAFGARDPNLDRGVQEKDLRNVLIGVAIAAVLGILVLVAIIVTIVLVVRRNRRRRMPPPGYPGYPQAPQPPYPPPP